VRDPDPVGRGTGDNPPESHCRSTDLRLRKCGQTHAKTLPLAQRPRPARAAAKFLTASKYSVTQPPTAQTNETGHEAGSIRQTGTSKTVWMTTNAKPYSLKDSTPTIPRSWRR
jgi:hypothetical protein